MLTSVLLFQTLSVSMLLRYSHHQIFVFIGKRFHISVSMMGFGSRRKSSAFEEQGNKYLDVFTGVMLLEMADRRRESALQS